MRNDKNRFATPFSQFFNRTLLSINYKSFICQCATFTITIYLFEKKIRPRELFCLIITSFCTIGLLPTVFNSIFLSTEDYSFAIMRGLSVYFYPLFLLLILTVVTCISIKRRFIFLVTSIALTYGWYSFIGNYIIKNYIASNHNRYAWYIEHVITSDPVGDECWRVIQKFKTYSVLDDLAKYGDSFSKIMISEKQSNGTYKVSYKYKDLARLQMKWNSLSPIVKIKIKNQETTLDSLSIILKYRISKEFLKNAEQSLKSQKFLYDKTDSIVGQGDLLAYCNFIKTINAAILDYNQLVNDEKENTNIRMKLEKYGLLFPRWYVK